LKINTLRFGEIEVSEDKIIYMPHGLIGFPELKRFFIGRRRRSAYKVVSVHR